MISATSQGVFIYWKLKSVHGILNGDGTWNQGIDLFQFDGARLESNTSRRVLGHHQTTFQSFFLGPEYLPCAFWSNSSIFSNPFPIKAHYFLQSKWSPVHSIISIKGSNFLPLTFNTYHIWRALVQICTEMADAI